MRLNEQLFSMLESGNGKDRIPFLKKEIEEKRINYKDILSILSEPCCHNLCDTRDDILFLISLGFEFRDSSSIYQTFTQKSFEDSHDINEVMQSLIYFYSKDQTTINFVCEKVTEKQILKLDFPPNYLENIASKRKDLHEAIFEKIVNEKTIEEECMENLSSKLNVKLTPNIENLVDKMNKINFVKRNHLVYILTYHDYENVLKNEKLNSYWQEYCEYMKKIMLDENDCYLKEYNTKQLDGFASYINQTKTEDDKFIFFKRKLIYSDYIASKTNLYLNVELRTFVLLKDNEFKSNVFLYKTDIKDKYCQHVIDSIIGKDCLIKYFNSPDGISFSRKLIDVTDDEKFKEWINKITPKQQAQQRKFSL
jgi:hypothetical protein